MMVGLKLGMIHRLAEMRLGATVLTRTELLEERLAQLEAKVKELKGTVEPERSVALHDPYPAASTTSMRQVAMARVQEDFPTQISEMLVSTFLRAASVLGFVLEPKRFKDHFLLPTRHPSRPHLALCCMVYTWAIRIHNTEDLKQFESLYLQRTISSLQNASHGGHEGRNEMCDLHVLQAEVLLAQYYNCLGHILRARYHTSAAVTFTYIHGLEGSRSTGDAQRVSFDSGLSASRFRGLPLRGDLASTERAHLFWAVFVLDTCWSAALKMPCLLSDNVESGTQINTPWSIQTNACASGQTVQRLFLGEGVLEGDDSFPVLRAKLSAIYGRAVDLASRSHSESVKSEAQAIAQIVAAIVHNLQPLDQLHNISDDVRLRLAVNHSIAHASMIHLYGALPQEASVVSSQPVLSHAFEILAILELVDAAISRHLEDHAPIVPDPFLAVIGSAAGRVFTDSLLSIENTRGPHNHAFGAQQHALRASINCLIDILQNYAGSSNIFPVFAIHANEIKRYMQAKTS
ncbi:hypothetical protein A7U60_g4967 [Sanghuangporus baumii]|uniref:Xylanolytic transcriptional activator regulatory domain-containing protein n=1 Tax=Sanghuangporus baumii TaxID=108892 RepID=A0A9Q5HXK2_SANBA|nr:hypothetical protein A7U60_g4967 [Sanghuangporus baumii]